jgi:outer membrane protein TolC
LVLAWTHAGQAGAPERLTLDQVLILAEQNYPKIAQAAARLKHKEAQLSEARRAPYAEFQLNAFAAVLPAWRGTGVFSPSTDVAFASDSSIAYQVAIEGVIPIWTFGKLTNLWDAARANVELGKGELLQERSMIRREARRAFYGLQLARDAKLLVGEAQSRVTEYVERLERELAAGHGDEIDLLQLKVQRAELTARGSEAERGEQIALSALRFYTGKSGELDIVDEPLLRMEHELGPAARYLEAARLHRPEVNMVRAGLEARQAQVGIEKARYLPDLGLGLSARFNQAPGVTAQPNPFVYDPLNTPIVGAGLVLRWKLDFFPQAARVAQASADLEEMRATERYALGGIAVEVEKAYQEAKDAERRLLAWGEAARYAKQWLIKVQQGLDLGISEDEDLVEPSKEYALKRFSEMSAILDYNLALADLARATGWESMLTRQPDAGSIER